MQENFKKSAKYIYTTKKDLQKCKSFGADTRI